MLEQNGQILLTDFQKNFVENVVNKGNALPFRIPEGITLVMVDLDTGKISDFKKNKFIYESFKTENIGKPRLELIIDKDKNIYNYTNRERILKFY